MTRAASRRALAAATCAAVVSGPALAAVLTAGAAAPGPCTGVRTRADGWQTLPPPPGFADTGVVRYAVAPGDPGRLYATDGHLVASSSSGGCHWDTVLDRDLLVTSDVTHVDVDRVVDLDVPAGDADVVHAVVEADVAGVRRTDVVTSADGGLTWTSAGLGLPLLSGRASLSASSTSADTAYLTVDTTVGPGAPSAAPTGGPAVYVTTDAGRSWSRASSYTDAPAVAAVVPDPAAPGRLIARGPDGIAVSDDGGATFAGVSPAGGAVTDLAVAAMPSGTRVVAAVTDAPVLRRSRDGGRTWRPVALPAPAHSVAAMSGADVAAVAVDGAVLLLVGADLLDVTPTGGPAGGLTLVASDAGPALHAMADGAILRRSLPTRDAVALPKVELHAAAPPGRGTPVLAPAHTDVLLDAGASQVVPYTLDLPAEPTPLDVFFLVDTTGSMQPAIAGLREGLAQIVNDLAAAGIAAQFGVGEFKDYPISPWGSPGDTPYRLVRAIGPVDGPLERAIEELTASGGGDGPEAALPGLLQATTGAGQQDDRVPAAYIPPRQSAGFRPGSLRVIVTVTDMPFHRESEYPGPTFARTVEALQGRDVRQVGLAVNGGGRADLVEMAGATRAFAPATGLDCDGDGRLDLAPGAPLVCDVGDSELLGLADNDLVSLLRPRISIAPAVIGLLRSVRDEAAVELQALRPDISRVMGTARIGRVDGKTSHRLHFLVRYTCPADGQTNNAPAPLRAIRRDVVLAEASAFLRCIPPIAPVDELLPPRALPALAAIALLPPPPPPPAPIPQTQVNANTDPNANPQAQAHGQPAAVAAQQREHEFVVVDSRDERPQPAEELAMSARSREEDAGVAMLAMAGAVVVCAAATTAFARGGRAVSCRVRSERP